MEVVENTIGWRPKIWKQPVIIRKKKVRAPIMGQESTEQGRAQWETLITVGKSGRQWAEEPKAKTCQNLS